MNRPRDALVRLFVAVVIELGGPGVSSHSASQGKSQGAISGSARSDSPPSVPMNPSSAARVGTTKMPRSRASRTKPGRAGSSIKMCTSPSMPSSTRSRA